MKDIGHIGFARGTKEAPFEGRLASKIEDRIVFHRNWSVERVAHVCHES
jgi:hypothetical protein